MQNNYQILLNKFETTSNNKRLIVKKIIVESIYYACQIHDVIAVCNPVNESSYALIYDGAATKAHQIAQKTERYGLARGYILDNGTSILDHSFFPINITLGNAKFGIVVNNNQTIIKPADEISILDTHVYAMCDNHNRYVTSDLDILMLIPNNRYLNRSKIKNSGMGDVLEYEFDYIKTLNSHFEMSLRKVNSSINKNKIQVVRHGPFNRFDGTKQSHIHFPLRVYFPSHKTHTIGEEKFRSLSILNFQYFLEKCINKGYFPDIHCNWNLQITA